MKNAIGFVFSLVFIFSAVSLGFDVPQLTGPIVDKANLLSANDQVVLGQLIRAVHDRGLAQIQVVILKNLQGETIESASIKITDAWKLGDAKKDNGVLFLIALEDKKMRIEVGQGLEGDIPDVIARRILETRVQPLFKRGRFSQGIHNGILAITRQIDPQFGKSLDAESAAPTRKNKNWMFFVYLVIFIIISLMRSRSGFVGRRDWSSWGGGFGGGSGGGGWSGGGGGFSGGGSSSGW